MKRLSDDQVMDMQNSHRVQSGPGRASFSSAQPGPNLRYEEATVYMRSNRESCHQLNSSSLMYVILYVSRMLRARGCVYSRSLARSDACSLRSPTRKFLPERRNPVARLTYSYKNLFPMRCFGLRILDTAELVLRPLFPARFQGAASIAVPFDWGRVVNSTCVSQTAHSGASTKQC